MEVKIGIQSVQRELVVETDTPAEELERSLTEVLGAGAPAVFTLSMAKGGKVVVPADRATAARGVTRLAAQLEAEAAALWSPSVWRVAGFTHAMPVR